MNRSLLSLLAVAVAASATPDHTLLFTNGDQLHGHYQGIGEGNMILWSRDDVKTPLSLKSENIRDISLRGVDPRTDESFFAHVSLINGDKIPGEVLSFDEENTRIRSHVVGEITLPSDCIATINSNPFGGKLLYAGPFSPAGWKLIKPVEKNTSAAVRRKIAKADVETPEHGQETLPADPKKEAAWQHSGSAWHHLSGMDILARMNCLGESSRLSFRLAWSETLNLNIALHADFTLPPTPIKNDGANGEKAAVNALEPLMFFNGMPQTHSASYGNALVLNIRQTYCSLTRCGSDANGKVIEQNVVRNPSGIQLSDSGEATIEVRSNRAKNLLILFINGRYAAQWEDIDNLKLARNLNKDAVENLALGNGFAIQCNVPLSLSEMAISEWSGLKDSAQSMSLEERDVVLLTNGTDRYSGEITQIKDNKARFKNSYTEFEIPLQEISEIVFAKKLLKETEQPADGTVIARFYPIGRISGLPRMSDKNTLTMIHPIGMHLNVDLGSANSLEFSAGNPLF